ncbi:hypothetical protein CC86DRAFT_380990 [Ophiobolus disseminans]|uniref:Lysine-specific metallo-endopeptidase domain-containing protein n=1 Tax=Ophiobolus disseminans TaxID=1469910 RepID=A0A6A7A5Z8_9PLEO|nr:hypothetical protein CC86DRAFT_380990 [Ophiobolus disseminans]
MIVLANIVYHKNADSNRWPRIFGHYFNDGDQAKVNKEFSVLVGEGEPHDPTGGAAFMDHVYITNHAPRGFERACDEKGLAAFTHKIEVSGPEPDKWVITLCNWAYEFPLYTKTGCDKLGDQASGLMDTMDGIILHEMMHIDTHVGIPAIGQHIEDHGDRGYGPLNTRRFKDNPINDPPKTPTIIELMLRNFCWTELCNKEFKDATDNTPFPEVEPNNNPAPSPPPAAAKTKAVTIVYQRNAEKLKWWHFFPGKYGESMVCRPRKNTVYYPTLAMPDKSGIMPYPAGTFPMGTVHGRTCEYENDGKGNPGMLSCKEKDGTDVGIGCKEDPDRTVNTAVNCAKIGDPGLYNIVVGQFLVSRCDKH